jgi:hypothetical protein
VKRRWEGIVRRQLAIEFEDEPHGSTHTAAGADGLPRRPWTTVCASISHAKETTWPSWE